MGNGNAENINRQLSTNLDNFTDPYDDLSAVHRHAIDLRIEGMKYKDIAKELNAKYQTVRSWFAKKGVCYEAYNSRKKLTAQDRRQLFKQIDEKLKDLAIDAILVISNSIRHGNSRIALEVLKMAGFEQVHKIEDVTKKKGQEEKLMEIINQLTKDAKSEISK